MRNRLPQQRQSHCRNLQQRRLAAHRRYLQDECLVSVILKQARREKDRKRLKEIVEFVKRGKGAELKWLRSSVRFLDVIPQSSSGKILLRMLRGDVNKEQEGGRQRQSYDIFFISISAVFCVEKFQVCM